jgi:hypothetical protein
LAAELNGMTDMSHTCRFCVPARRRSSSTTVAESKGLLPLGRYGIQVFRSRGYHEGLRDPPEKHPGLLTCRATGAMLCPRGT